MKPFCESSEACSDRVSQVREHGDAAQLAANAGRKVTSELWQRNLFKRTKRDAQKRTCEAGLSKTALESHKDANACLDKSYIYALAQIRTYMIARTHIDTHIHVLWCVSRIMYFGACRNSFSLVARVENHVLWCVSKLEYFGAFRNSCTLVRSEIHVLWCVSITYSDSA